jgi:hypothetical protein
MKGVNELNVVLEELAAIPYMLPALSLATLETAI